MKSVNQRNPILPLEHHVPDSEAHVMPDGRLYLYGSYDLHSDVYCSEEYHVVSTPDLKHWEIEDRPSLRGREIPWFNNPDAPKYPGIDWANPTPFIRKMLAEHPVDKEAFEKAEEGPKPALLFAPDCIFRNGKYYLYFCMSDDSEGVAVSDRPTGPFTDPVQLPCGGIDPAVFIDTDGQAYFYWGQLFSHGVRLNPDMIGLIFYARSPRFVPALILPYSLVNSSSMRLLYEVFVSLRTMPSVSAFIISLCIRNS